ncbi:macrolide family glycosyltransferase [Clostridium psychrophilum]|uniref:macrolide family glycosyltransferase n=1 Tax=Clostridium psychrophilum TaxID=132926 RepID=UPI001C0BDAE1|nr:macrolide family glycosyltransferase [Clostridium psychrophilum]MBU3183179.1 glycosyl transferase [Clostridium psychrophilum]
MKKALFINMCGQGHFNPTIGLVKELINRGEKVTYIAGEEFRNKVENTGAKFKGYKKSFDVQNLFNGNLNLENNEPLLKVIGTFKDIVDTLFNSNEKFDYIIYDSAFMLGNEVGRLLKIPAICSITTFAANKRTNCLLAQIKKFGPNIQKLLNSLEYINFVKYLKEEYGIKCPSIITAVSAKGMINIVYTSKYFQLCGESFDESYKFIGPSIITRKEDLNFSLDHNEKKKIIYISLGTIFNNSFEFYENCFKAFDNMNVKIIMSVGKNTDINKFKSMPSNFIVRNYVSQLEVLKIADVFITHGGMNSTNEALYYDVPLILIPQFIDQPSVANRVAELGAGIVIEKDNVTPKVLAQSVVDILSNNNFKTSSKQIGKSLREAGGYKKGVDEILNSNFVYEEVACDIEK